jgi:DNA-binding transcriptional LysR family regulator
MHVDQLDLNLLRLFNAIYETRNVSRAAERLNLSQPVVSQGLARLRRALGDALFARTVGGVRPSPYADRLAPAVRAALDTLERALSEGQVFDPSSSQRVFRLHMSDIGEWRFLPRLMAALRREAPSVRVDTQYINGPDLERALDLGTVDFAFGFLPRLKGMQSASLLTDRYVIVVHRGHPVARKSARGGKPADWLSQLEFAAVRTHADTTRLLQMMQLDGQLRLTVEHFTALPSIVAATDLAAIMPRAIGKIFPAPAYTVIDPAFPTGEFSVLLHWSKRFENEPAIRWFRDLVLRETADPGDRRSRTR